MGNCCGGRENESSAPDIPRTRKTITEGEDVSCVVKNLSAEACDINQAFRSFVAKANSLQTEDAEVNAVLDNVERLRLYANFLAQLEKATSSSFSISEQALACNSPPDAFWQKVSEVLASQEYEVHELHSLLVPLHLAMQTLQEKVAMRLQFYDADDWAGPKLKKEADELVDAGGKIETFMRAMSFRAEAGAIARRLLPQIRNAPSRQKS